jgi:hypothetical protein
VLFFASSAPEVPTLKKFSKQPLAEESKQELKDRIMAAMDEFNRHPVVHTWSYKLDEAA